MSEELKGSSGDPPYAQFDSCIHPDIDCKYKDVQGLCIWEHCLYDEQPNTNLLWYYKCIICGETDAADPKELKVPFCKKCVERFQAKETLPVECWVCHKTIDRPPEMPFSGMCDECSKNLSALILWQKAGRPGC